MLCIRRQRYCCKLIVKIIYIRKHLNCSAVILGSNKMFTFRCNIWYGKACSAYRSYYCFGKMHQFLCILKWFGKGIVDCLSIVSCVTVKCFNTCIYWIFGYIVCFQYTFIVIFSILQNICYLHQQNLFLFMDV